MAKNIPIEIREFLPRIEADIDQRFPIASFFLFFMLVLKFGFEIPLPTALFYLVALVSLISVPVAFFFERLKKKNPRRAINLYFSFLHSDLILLTAIIYFVGGITWIIPGIYLFYTLTSFWLFPSFQAIFFTGWASLLLIVLASLQYLGILDTPQIFLAKEKLPQNFPYLLTSTIGVLAILGFVGYTNNTFYKLLTGKIKELKKTEGELTTTRDFLKKEVAEKTKELEKEKGRLEKEIREKTAGLEEKKRLLEKRVLDLEKFYKMAVARELKIAKLKEEIMKFKK